VRAFTHSNLALGHFSFRNRHTNFSFSKELISKLSLAKPALFCHSHEQAPPERCAQARSGPPVADGFPTCPQCYA